MKPINFTPPPTTPLHHHSPPPTSSSMIITTSTSKPTTTKPLYHRMPPLLIPTVHNSGLSPFEKLYGTSPDYSSLRVFGCTCFVLKPHVERTKLSNPLYVGSWVMVLVKRDIVVMIRLIILKNPITPESALETTSETITTKETPPVMIYEATPTGLNHLLRLPDRLLRLQCSFIAYVHRLHEPESYKEVVCDPLWQVVMVEELAALHQTQTWDLVPLTVGKHAIGSRWVYKTPNLMVPLKDIRPVLLQKAMLKSMV
nr:Gag-Pol polyprotein [Tanacetum cinerariifolium]